MVSRALLREILRKSPYMVGTVVESIKTLLSNAGAMMLLDKVHHHKNYNLNNHETITQYILCIKGA